MIYKFANPNEHALKNLSSVSLYCRHYEDFNDPFEFWAIVHCGMPDFADDDERFHSAVAAWGFPDHVLSELPVDLDTLKDYFEGLADGEIVFPHIYNHSRVSCFSSDPSSLLMWSHYADGLRGFCIEFDDDLLISEDEYTFLCPVNYVEEPPVVDSFVYAVTEDQFYYAIDHGYEEYDGESFRADLNGMMKKALASKPLEWRYEKEVRLVVNTRNNDKSPILHQYNQEALKSIIIGERMPESYKTGIRDVLAKLDYHVNTKIAVRSRERYEINIEEFEL